MTRTIARFLVVWIGLPVVLFGLFVCVVGDWLCDDDVKTAPDIYARWRKWALPWRNDG